MPIGVRLATTLFLILAVYAAFMVIPTGLVGAFVGPPVLYACAVHAAVAALLFPCWYGLREGRRRARWLSVAVSLVVAPTILVAIYMTPIERTDDVIGMSFFGIIGSIFALNASLLLTNHAGFWFTRS